MSAPNVASLPPFIVPISTANSNSLEWNKYCSDAEALSIISPATLDVLTFSLQVSHDNEATWATLNDITNTALPLPSASCAIVYNGLIGGFTHIRIHVSSTVAAARTFTAKKIWRGI